MNRPDVEKTEIPETLAGKFLVDVRTPDEYRRESIPGSVNIPLDKLSAEISRLIDKPEIVLTCQSGRRATEAKAILESLGCLNATVLEGGLAGWKLAGHSVAKRQGGISIMRQVQMIAGLMVLGGTLYQPLWFLALLAGGGLFVAGLTNTCVMATLLGKMPWNRFSESCDIPSVGFGNAQGKINK